MWFFFYRKSVRRYGKETTGDCPKCNAQTRVMEIIEEQGNSSNVVAYHCMQCGDEYTPPPPITLWGVIKVGFALIVLFIILKSCVCGHG